MLEYHPEVKKITHATDMIKNKTQKLSLKSIALLLIASTFECHGCKSKWMINS